jgi:hypothetical protein
MNPWLQALGALALIAAGAVAGLGSSRLRKPWWALGYLAPLVLICLIGLARRWDALAFHAPFSWAMSGRTEFVVLAVSCMMVFTTPLVRLEPARARALVAAFAAGMSLYAALPPFLAPVLIRSELESLRTVADVNGVCAQTTPYTCGPAAAVTALGRLGLRGEEGEIAILAFTNSYSGTQPDCLVSALRERFGAEGLSCEYRLFDSVDELARAGTTIAVTRYAFLVDHYVAVLGVTNEFVDVGDPAGGRKRYTRRQFEEIWRRSGVVLRRAGPPASPPRPPAPPPA